MRKQKPREPFPRTEKRDDGISQYKVTRRAYVDAHDPPPPVPLDAWLATLDALAGRKAAEAARVEGRDTASVEWHVYREMENLQSYIKGLRRAMKAHKTTEAARLGIHIGMACERLNLREHAEQHPKMSHLARGRKVLQAAKDGHAAVHGSPREKAERYAAYRAAFEEARKENPHQSKEWCYTKTARQFSKSVRTIKRACLQK